LAFMATHQSLDDLIARKASAFADEIKGVAAMATKEEEIRIATENQLAFIKQEAGIELKGQHEFTLASGRVDSVYQCVIIEYKNPSSAGAKIGPNANSPGAKKVVEQIKKRFYDMRTEHGHALNTLFGVGLDGKHFIFVRYREDKWQVQDPVEVNKISAEQFLWALFNMGTKGKPFSPEYLAGDFGSDAKPAQDGICALYNAIATTTHPKAQVFFSQWKILFGEVCGYDVDNPSDKIKKLADFYGVPDKDLKAAELLFAVHTYYAIFMKLLASEIVAFFHKLPTPLEKMMRAGTSNKLKAEMEDLESGSIFYHLNITNFLEGDLFAWYVPAWSDEIEKLVRYMVTRLDDYNPGTLSEDPAGSRDLLKKLYQQLFPKSVRHDLGEYYTPDWLAEHVLNELEYVGDPDKRLLDPACGSGTFLVMAINRIRKWYDTNREKCHYDEGDLCRKILANVVGFDLNPLAVMAARTNYLIAIRDLIGRMDKVEIPIYLCDSILTPSAYGGLWGGTTDAAKELKTAAAKFLVPTEIATNRDDVARYAEQLEKCVKAGYPPKEFIQRCQDEGLPVNAEKLHVSLYRELVALDKANKNGVWARIIKNSFAPLFIGRVDYVAGNPPWINWENLPDDYRQASLPIWNKYGLRETGGGKAAIGKSKHELAGLFLYASADSYLKDDCRLGFVITQSLFKNRGAAGFRSFSYDSTFLVPIAITDMAECTVFEGAVNRTATIVVEKRSAGFAFPIPYAAWLPKQATDIPEDLDLDTVKTLVNVMEMKALPSDQNAITSTWLTCPAKVYDSLNLVLGKAYYRAFEGVNSGGAVGVYRVRKLRELNTNTTLIENLGESGRAKVPCVMHQIEDDLLYPYVRGRDILRWRAEAPSLYLLTHDPETRKPISEKVMKIHYPQAFEYLLGFKKLLLARKTAPVRQQMEQGFFYAILGVGPYTVSPWKVVFKDLTEAFQCCVLGPNQETGRVVIPDYTLRLIPADSKEEAHYIAALLNSAPSLAALYYSSTGVQTQRYHASDAEKIAVPMFRGSAAQKALGALSIKCHDAASKGDWVAVRELEERIDGAAAKMWGISMSDLSVIQAVICNLRKPETLAGEGDSED